MGTVIFFVFLFRLHQQVADSDLYKSIIHTVSPEQTGYKSMKKEEIIEQLERSYAHFTDYVNDLTPDEFEFAPEPKWSAGQQTEHLIKSTKPLASGLGMPKFLLKSKFGKANRPSRSYDAVVERYKEKLALGGTATSPYVPGKVLASSQKKLTTELTETIAKLNKKLDKWSEEDLDKYVLPHPLLGKLTTREMLYFTMHHASHHQLLIKLYLKGV